MKFYELSAATKQEVMSLQPEAKSKRRRRVLIMMSELSEEAQAEVAGLMFNKALMSSLADAKAVDLRLKGD